MFNLCLSCVLKTYSLNYTFSIKRYNLFCLCRCFDIIRHIKDTKRPYLAISDIIHHIPTSFDTIRQKTTCKRLHFSNFVNAITFDTFRHFSQTGIYESAFIMFNIIIPMFSITIPNARSTCFMSLYNIV